MHALTDGMHVGGKANAAACAARGRTCVAQGEGHLRDDTVQTLLALADGSVRNFAADEDVCTVYNFISDCMKIVDDEVVPAAEAPPAE